MQRPPSGNPPGQAHASPRRKSAALNYLKNSPYTKSSGKKSKMIDQRGTLKRKTGKGNRKSIFVTSISPKKGAQLRLPRTSSFFNYHRQEGDSRFRKIETITKIVNKLKLRRRTKRDLEGDNRYAGRVWIRIVAGTDMKPCDSNGYSDPYVTVKINPREDKNTSLLSSPDKKAFCKAAYAVKYRTETKVKTLNPRWCVKNEFVLTVPLYSDVLHIEVWDADQFSTDDFMGQLDIPISSLQDSFLCDKRFKLHSRKKEKDIPGDLHLSILFTSINNSVVPIQTMQEESLPSDFDKKIPDESSSSRTDKKKNFNKPSITSQIETTSDSSARKVDSGQVAAYFNRELEFVESANDVKHELAMTTNITFDKVMQNPVLWVGLKRVLFERHSSELSEFLDDVQNFKRNYVHLSVEERIQAAQFILDNYIRFGSESEVNVKHGTKQTCAANLKKINALYKATGKLEDGLKDFANDVYRQVKKLIEVNFLHQFINSSHFQDACQKCIWVHHFLRASETDPELSYATIQLAQTELNRLESSLSNTTPPPKPMIDVKKSQT